MMICHHSLLRTCRFIFISLLFIFASNTQAAGFALIEQSVSSMGTAYAGAGSAGGDASYMFFNPATMSLLKGEQITNGLHIVLPNSEFSGDVRYNEDNLGILGASAAATVPFAGEPAGFDAGSSDGGTTGYIPHFAYVRDLNATTKLGLTINAPFGLKTKYDDDWDGRYSAIESEIFSLNINPNVSFKVNDTTTLGFGVSAMYAKLKLRNAVNDCLLIEIGLGPDACPVTDPGTVAALEGEAEHDLDDWGFGYNFGLLFAPNTNTRFGLAYRSQVKVDLEGDFTADGAVTGDKGALAKVTLPDTLLLSAWHQVNSKTAIMADVLWTRWSEVPELKVEYDDSSSNTFNLEWDDVFRIAVGATYQYDDKWTLRTGVAYDESPVPNAALRIAALPDDDRIWLDFGVGYRHSKQLSFDFGYAHLFIDDPKIDSTDAENSAIPVGTGLHRLEGQYDADVDIISAQLNYKF